MQALGLPKSFVPLIVGFGCNVGDGARTLDHHRANA